MRAVLLRYAMDILAVQADGINICLPPVTLIGGEVDEAVLLVEDESVIRTAVAEFLSGAGYHVLSAANGKEALAKLQAHSGKINLVITDVVMPVMSGPKLAESIASMHPQAKIQARCKP